MASGLSLLEVVVALAILAIAAAGLYAMAVSAASGILVSGEFLEAQQAARRGMDHLAEEVRWAEAVVADAGCTGSLCPDRVTVEVPPDNPVFPGCRYQVRFRHDGSSTPPTLRRELVGGTGPGCPATFGATVLASRIEEFHVEYCDAAGGCTPTASPAPGDVVRLQARVGVRRSTRLPFGLWRVSTDLFLRSAPTGAGGGSGGGGTVDRKSVV